MMTRTGNGMVGFQRSWCESVLMSMRALIGAAVTVVLFTSAAYAGTIVLAIGDGWCNTIAGCNNTNLSMLGNNTVAAATALSNTHDWFAFNDPMTGGPITAATLHIWNDGRNRTMDPLAFYNLHDASAITFAGLAKDGSLGSVALTAADTSVSHWVDISLNGLALSLLNAGQGSQFIFGGTVDTPSSDTSVIFGFTDGSPTAQLELETEAAVPEPSLIILLCMGMGAVSLIAWMDKKNKLPF